MENNFDYVSLDTKCTVYDEIVKAGFDPFKMLEFAQSFGIWSKNGLTAYPSSGKKMIDLFNQAKIKK